MVRKRILTLFVLIIFASLSFAKTAALPEGKIEPTLSANKGTSYPPAYISAQAFGAVGDGKKDDTAALQAALDAGGLVVLTKGTYKTTATLLIRSPNTNSHRPRSFHNHFSLCRKGKPLSNRPSPIKR